MSAREQDSRHAADAAGLAVHRIEITSGRRGVVVYEATNDDNDDGYPDGHWEAWSAPFPSEDRALAYAGKCRVGISGVVVTVTLNGEEVR